MVKSHSLTVKLPLILPILSSEERDGIPGVVVKYVDIWKNTSGAVEEQGTIVTGKQIGRASCRERVYVLV